jgi:nucleoside phosphorylase
MIPVVFNQICPEDDVWHEGVYTPDTRDTAEQFRYYLVNNLANTLEKPAYQTLLKLADDSHLANERNWFIRLADEHAEKVAENKILLQPTDIVNFAKMPNKTTSTAIVITALPVEYNAVIKHLHDLKEKEHSAGTIYEIGKFSSETQDWDVAVIQAGMGNPRAAFETERAITFFKPSHVIFVGVAGGLKDVNLGDVVAATKVYGFEYGKAEQQFKTRTEFGESAYSLIQRAQAISRQNIWGKRIQENHTTNNPPRAFVGPIAAGEKIVASTKSPTYELLKNNFSDALAVEMEGFGFFRTIHANHKVQALMVRGISDLIDKKSEADASGSQEIASHHAAAFAFEVLAKIKTGVDI